MNEDATPLVEIATLRIELADTSPPIWREIEVPIEITLQSLHETIQAAMGWLDYHLWEFTVANRRYGLPMEEDWGEEPRGEAAKVRLRDVLTSGNKADRFRTTKMTYLYDFGDDWLHDLTVKDVRQGEPGTSYPRYVAGQNNAPPEDCGGVPGFYEMLEVANNPAHPDHEDITEWLNGYDPGAIDENAVKTRLIKIAKKMKPAKSLRAKTKPKS